MSVFVNNLDDFILPSQDCINPFIISKKQDELAASTESNNKKFSNKIMIQNDDTISEYESSTKQLLNYGPQEPNLINIKYDSKNQKIASVSLNDCLACSGCITSAEAVLIQEQSYNRLLDVLTSKEKFVVVSLSPQSVASIANYSNLSQIETFLKISTHLKALGVQYIFDTSSGCDVSLLESRKEFLDRRKFGRGTQWIRPPTSMAYSSSRVLLPNESSGTALHEIQPTSISEFHSLTSSSTNNGSIPFAPLPMFCSHCPGWICFAEKTHPQCLPYISTTKSAQQIIGSIFKHILTQSTSVVDYAVQHENASSWTPQQVFHVSVQPCFDKKLEASRLDFLDEESGCQDVDLVISTTELWLLIEQTYGNLIHSSDTHNNNNNNNNISNNNNDSNSDISPLVYFHSIPCDAPRGRDSIENLFRSYSSESYQILSSVGANKNSNGYAEYLFRYLAHKLYSIDLSNQEIHYITGRNQDIAEATLYSNGTTLLPSSPLSQGEGQGQGKGEREKEVQGQGQGQGSPTPLLKFARIYGFRNIQSVILKMKRMKCEYDYVEIMACPSGCVNGGGQIKLSNNETPTEIQIRVADTSLKLHSNFILQNLEETPLIRYLYTSRSRSGPGCGRSEKRRKREEGEGGGEGEEDDSAMDLVGREGEEEGEGEEEELVSLFSRYFKTQYHAIPKLELMVPMASKW